MLQEACYLNFIDNDVLIYNYILETYAQSLYSKYGPHIKIEFLDENLISILFNKSSIVFIPSDLLNWARTEGNADCVNRLLILDKLYDLGLDT